MIEQQDQSLSSERIGQNLAAVKSRVAQAALRSGRAPEAVTVVAVTKRIPVDLVRLLVGAGAVDLGENYPQELWKKAETLALAGQGVPVRWHLIGHLQTNKAKRTLPMVAMVHAVDSLKLLRMIDKLAPGLAVMPSICLQVNTSGEETKHGWSAERILDDAEAIAACRAVPIVGLMTMAAQGTEGDSARPSFIRLRDIRDALRQRTGLPLPELSMGMSSDFEVAVEEGATLVRVGSALLEGVEA
jgi:pyridoxal phosphate enzyme (YggS family)